jgi:hypothetical protein
MIAQDELQGVFSGLEGELSACFTTTEVDDLVGFR